MVVAGRLPDRLDRDRRDQAALRRAACGIDWRRDGDHRDRHRADRRRRARHDADPRAPAHPRRGRPRPVAARPRSGGDPRARVEPGRRVRRRGRGGERGGRARGARSICDPTAMFLGRDVEFMRRVAEQTGLQVVPCTGIYTYDHLPPLLRQPRPRPDRRPVRRRHRARHPGDRDQGGVHQVRRRRARASPRTSRRSIAPRRGPACAPARRSWPTRVRRATPAPRQIEIFEEEGVDLSKVQIAHTGDTDDLDYIERLIEKGVYIGLDRYGLEMYLPYDQRDPDRRSRCSSAATPSGSSSRRTPARRSTGSRPRSSSSCSPPGWPRTGTSGSSPSG